MRQYQQMFMALCGAGIFGSPLTVQELPGKEAWEDLFDLSLKHEVLPLVCNTIYDSKLRIVVDQEVLKKAREKTFVTAQRQVVQTNEFLTLLLHAQAKGLDPIVLKGIVCRNLYPVPMLRPSVDEDLLICPEETEKYHSFFLSEGLYADEDGLSASERINAAELSYHKEKSPTYIELHKTLFDPTSELFGQLNDLFDGMDRRTVRVQIEDVSVRTLCPTDHLLYLILHAYKHFLYSGVGIRPMCDIGVYSETYSEEIDWHEIRRKLDFIQAFEYARAIFRIIQSYLLPNGHFFKYIKDWNLELIDVGPMVEDSMASGIHGASSMSRLHSSNITLYAAENGVSEGTDSLHVVLQSLFLPLRKMRSRYPYLKKAPFLLPIAWVHRIVKYLQEIRKAVRLPGSEDSAGDSIRIGKERIKILEKYNIIR